MLVNPYDPEAVGHAIERALIMSIEERRQRHAALYQVIAEHDINPWSEHFLTALAGNVRSKSSDLDSHQPDAVGPRLVAGGGTSLGLVPDFRA